MATRTNLRHRINARRLGALARLTRQLASGKRGEKKDIILTVKDRERMKAEITTLKSRVR